MVTLERINFIGEIPYTDSSGEKVLGTARIEQTRSGHLITHVNAAENPDAIIEGFTFGIPSYKGESCSIGSGE
jgi:hypothetical protein